MSEVLWRSPNFVQFGTQSNTLLPVLQGGSGAATLTGYIQGNGTDPFTASPTIPFSALTGVPPSAGTGNVVGPAGANSNFPALFDGATGLLIKEGSAVLGTAAYAATTAFDAAGAAATAMAAHLVAADPHVQYALESALGTASTQNTGAFEAAGAVATHAALASGVHGITAAAATVLDDASTAAMLTTLGAQPADADLTTIAGLTPTTDNFIQSKASAWASRTVAQVSVDLQATGLITDAVGFRTIPQNSQSSAYTTVAADSGKHLYHPGADTTARVWTIDSNANVPYPIGTAITFVNDTLGGVITIAITADTLVLAGAGTTGSRTLAASGMATAIKVTSSRWVISGTGLT